MIGDGFVTLRKEDHRYFDKDGKEYTSWSKVLSGTKAPFDGMKIALRTTKGNVEEAKKLVDSWTAFGKEKAGEGTELHDNLESFGLSGSCDKTYIKLAKDIYKNLFLNYNELGQEIAFYDKENLIAGTADISGIRRKVRTAQAVLDIFDYKSNVIKHDTIKRDEETKAIIKHYDRYMTGMFSGTEDCNYHHYSGQLNTYGFMAEKEYNYKIGRLGIIRIDFKNEDQWRWRVIPVPYFACIGYMFIKNFKDKKPLPINEEFDIPVTEEEIDY